MDAQIITSLFFWLLFLTVGVLSNGFVRWVFIVFSTFNFVSAFGDVLSYRLTGGFLNNEVLLYANFDSLYFSKFLLDDFLLLSIVFIIAFYFVFIKVLKRTFSTIKMHVSYRLAGITVLTLLIPIIFLSGTGSMGRQVELLTTLFESAGEDGGVALDSIVTQKRFDSKKPNVVRVILESFDGFYFDKEFKDELTPELSDIYHQSIRFSNIRSVPGMMNSISGLFASDCGFPLQALGVGVGYNSILNQISTSEITCFNDVLKKEGYSSYFFSGSNLKFGGQERFLNDHGYNTQDLNNIKPVRLSKFGAYDSDLLEYVFLQLELISRNAQPWAVTVATTDTHVPGALNPSCGIFPDLKKSQLIGLEHTLAKTIRCSSAAISNFVKMTLEKFPNTVFIFQSDHILPAKLTSKIDRRYAFFIYNSSSRPTVVDKFGSIMDFSPTIASLLGLEITGLGIAKNILKNSSISSVESASKNVQIYSNLASAQSLLLQQKIHVGDSFQYDPQQPSIEIGGFKFIKNQMFQRSIKVPFLTSELLFIRIGLGGLIKKTKGAEIINQDVFSMDSLNGDGAIVFGGTSNICSFVERESSKKLCRMSPFGIALIRPGKSTFEFYRPVNINELFTLDDSHFEIFF